MEELKTTATGDQEQVDFDEIERSSDVDIKQQVEENKELELPVENEINNIRKTSLKGTKTRRILDEIKELTYLLDDHSLMDDVYTRLATVKELIANKIPKESGLLLRPESEGMKVKQEPKENRKQVKKFVALQQRKKKKMFCRICEKAETVKYATQLNIPRYVPPSKESVVIETVVVDHDIDSDNEEFFATIDDFADDLPDGSIDNNNKEVKLHWVAVSSYSCKDGEIDYMDSLNRWPISLQVKKQICAIMHCSVAKIKVNILAAQ